MCGESFEQVPPRRRSLLGLDHVGRTSMIAQDGYSEICTARRVQGIAGVSAHVKAAPCYGTGAGPVLDVEIADAVAARRYNREGAGIGDVLQRPRAAIERDLTCLHPVSLDNDPAGDGLAWSRLLRNGRDKVTFT